MFLNPVLTPYSINMKRLLYLLLFIPFLLEGQGLVFSDGIVFTDSLLWVNGTGIVKDRNEIIKTPEISDCILHLSTEGKQFADGDTIQTWEDNTIYGNDASQATETNRPTYDLTNDTGSLVFDGVDNYMDMGSILNIGKVHTISFWVNNTDFTTLNTITANGVNYTIRMSSTYLYYIINGSTYSFLNPFSTNKWYHVVIVRNGTALSTYFNGIAGATATITSVNNIDMTYRYIGMRTNNLYLVGKLDDIQIFSKALSTSEITSLYNEKVSKLKLINVQ